MSYKFLSVAWEAPIESSDKFVLVSLADQANDAGVCWPSVTTLARRTGLADRSVQRSLVTLESLGYIRRDFRAGTSTNYILSLTPDKSSVVTQCHPRQSVTTPLTQCHPTPDTVSPRTISEPKEEPTPLSNPPGFDEFWAAYPKKVGKAKCIKLWKTLKVNGRLSKVLSAIASQKGTDQWKKDGGQYIPLPATWLHQGRWDDEVSTPVAKPAYQSRNSV